MVELGGQVFDEIVTGEFGGKLRGSIFGGNVTLQFGGGTGRADICRKRVGCPEEKS